MKNTDSEMVWNIHKVKDFMSYYLKELYVCEAMEQDSCEIKENPLILLKVTKYELVSLVLNTMYKC